MPRIKRNPHESPAVQFPALLRELVGELKNSRESGQPRIEEQCFPKTGAIRVTAIWDKWLPLSDEERSTVIRHAYEEVEGKEFRDRIALAIGLTFPEAFESGLLPFQIMSAVRKGDPVTSEQCANAMIAQGASLLFEPGSPQLRFATEEEAEACRQRLIQALPGSEQVWVIAKEMGHVEQPVG